MQVNPSPTLALAKSLGLAVIHPSPACDHFDHGARPASHWVNAGGRRPVWLRACQFCAANARTQGLELEELTTDTPPAGIQNTLPI